MKRFNHIIVLVFFIFLSKSITGQEIVITERGDSIVLYSNGTWDYYDNYLNSLDTIPKIRFNHIQYIKSKTSTKKIAGKNLAYELWYNEENWKRVPVGEINLEADIALKYNKGDVYALVIFEEVGLPCENMSKMAIDYAVNAAPDIKMIDQEYRIVNSDTLIWMRMDGTIKGLKLSYYSYYFSNENC